MRVVVDTNVWVSGLILPDGAPGRVLDAARRGLFTPLASWDLAEEIVDVLRRPRLRRYRITEDDIRDVLAVLGALLPNVVVDVTVRDPRDAPVVGAAIAARADALVTGDKDLLEDPDLIRWLAEQHVDVLDPPALLARLRWGGDPSTPRNLWADPTRRPND